MGKRLNEINGFSKTLFHGTHAFRTSTTENIGKATISRMEYDSEKSYSDSDMSATYSDSEYEDSNILESLDVNLKSKAFSICRRDILGNFMCEEVCSVCDVLLESGRSKWDIVTQSFPNKCGENLKTFQNIPCSVRIYYSLSHIILQLNEVLLCPGTLVKREGIFQIKFVSHALIPFL